MMKKILKVSFIKVTFLSDYLGNTTTNTDLYHFYSEAQALKKKKALGTTVFHFVQGAKTVDAVLKELLRRIKSAQYDHNLVMRPFMLSVALGLTSIEHIKSTVIPLGFSAFARN